MSLQNPAKSRSKNVLHLCKARRLKPMITQKFGVGEILFPDILESQEEACAGNMRGV